MSWNNSKATSKRSREEETAQLIEYVIKRCEESNELDTFHGMVANLMEDKESTTPNTTLRSRVDKYQAAIKDNAQLDFTTKLRQLIGFGVEIDKDFQKRIKERGDSVRLYRNNRILEYRAKDDALIIRSMRTSIKRKQGAEETEKNNEEEEGEKPGRSSLKITKTHLTRGSRPSPNSLNVPDFDETGVTDAFNSSQIKQNPDIHDNAPINNTHVWIPQTVEDYISSDALVAFLNSIDALTRTLELQMPDTLASIQRTVDKIVKFTTNGQGNGCHLTVSDFVAAVNATLKAISRSEEPAETENTRSVKCLLIFLQRYILFMKNPLLNELETTMKQTVADFCFENEISVERVQQVLVALIVQITV